jgi:hypothetical protein
VGCFRAVTSVSEKHADYIFYIFRALLLWGSFISEDETNPELDSRRPNLPFLGVCGHIANSLCWRKHGLKQV